MAPFARSNTKAAIRVSFDWIPSGSRRRARSRRWDSDISSTASIPCCSCSASSCRSGSLAQLVAIVGAFAAAHSVTFVASAFGMAPGVSWFPPLVDHARRDLDPLRGGRQRHRACEPGGPGASAFSRRWMTAFAFGLVHGFAFSFALGQTLQFAGSHVDDRRSLVQRGHRDRRNWSSSRW